MERLAAKLKIRKGQQLLVSTESKADVQKRLLAHVKKNKNGCWEWQHFKNWGGYGLMTFGGKSVTTHRVSWAAFRGNPGKLFVLHKCDNRSCINPGHLFLGTNKDNIRDAMSKGRHSRGETHGRSKLSKEQVLEILAIGRNQNMTVTGKKYGVSKYTISKIVCGIRWKHISASLPEPPSVGGNL